MFQTTKAKCQRERIRKQQAGGRARAGPRDIIKFGVSRSGASGVSFYRRPSETILPSFSDSLSVSRVAPPFFTRRKRKTKWQERHYCPVRPAASVVAAAATTNRSSRRRPPTRALPLKSYGKNSAAFNEIPQRKEAKSKVGPGGVSRRTEPESRIPIQLIRSHFKSAAAIGPCQNNFPRSPGEGVEVCLSAWVCLCVL